MPHDVILRPRLMPVSYFYAVAGLSGFAGLGYELTWTRMLGLALGHEIVAALCVVMGFFGGVALGSFVLGSRIERSPVPSRWYAGLELAIAAWCLLQIAILPWLGHLVPALLGPDPSTWAHWTVVFGAAFLALLPATFAMGATLPALAAMLGALRPGRAPVGGVYGANTFGAVAGTLLSTFWIAPALGFTATLLLLAAVNIVCAAAASTLARATPVAGAPAGPAGLAVGPAVATDRRLLGTLFATGLLGIGYEVLVVRVLSQLLENTVYTFAVLLAVYLFGTALGGVLQSRLKPNLATILKASKLAPARLAVDGWLIAVAAACLLGTLSLFAADQGLAELRLRLAPTLAAGIVTEMLLGAMVLLLPSIAMGGLFSELGENFRPRRGGLGRAVGWNTLGAAAAPIAFGLGLLPIIGAKASLAGIALGYVALARPAGFRARAAAACTALAAIVVLVVPARLQFVHVPPGGALIEQIDGVMASVAVVQDRGGERRLQVNSHFRMGGTATIRLDRRQAYLPLLLHPHPTRALFLGLGTGTTVAAAADYPGLATDGVELLPEVIPVLPLFEKSAGNLAQNPNLRLHVADARRFVRAATADYDVIVADLYHPSLDGSGALYTSEHFAAIQRRLAAGGVFCQWLPLHQLDLPTLAVIVRSFLAVFPHGAAYIANFGLETPLIGLIGQEQPARYTAGWFDRAAPDTGLRENLAAVGFTDDLSLFGGFIADAAALSDFAGPGPVNTDDRPVIAFSAPGMVYAAQDSAASRLLRLLELFHPQPFQLLAGDASDLSRRLAAYWQARDLFLVVGNRALREPNGGDPIRRLVPPLLAVLRISPDFDPAYLPLLAMARNLADRDPAGGLQLLAAIDAVAPARAEMRRRLDALR